MKQLFAMAAIVAASLFVGSGAANAAQPSLSVGIGVESYRPWTEAIQEVGHKKNKHNRHKHNNWGHHHKHNNGGVFFLFGSHGPTIHYKKQQRQYVRKCHGVVTDGYFHGRYAKLGGTMCYDRAGHGYIVDGSRYLIKYY